MAKDYNSYDFNPSVLLPGTLKRNGAWPLDMSALFLSVNDAIKYARGDIQDLDERKLGLQAYAGQIIGVKAGTIGSGDNETGLYDAYIIQGDGTIKKLSGSENNPPEEKIIESSIVNVIIPNGEGSTLPEPVIGDYQLGYYFYNTTDEKLYILQNVKIEENGVTRDEIQWIVAPKTQPFISQDLTQVYFYHKDEETEIVKWMAEDGSSEKIYLSTNTSTLYYWDAENHIFTTNSGENNYVTNSIHFLKADYCVDEGGAFPELTQKEIGKVLIKYVSEGVYLIYEWTYDTSNETGEWVQILDPIYEKVIYFPNEPDTEYRLFKDDIDGDVVPGNNIYTEYTEEDKFQENVFYVNDLTGSVYGWNGEYMELLSNEELSELLPKTLPVTYCNTSHTYEMKKKKAIESSASESNWATRYLPLLEAVKNVLTPLTIPAEYTLPVINQESGICTVFNVLIKQEGKDKIVQYLYNSDVEYHRVKYPNSSKNEWRKWYVNFKKTDVKFEIKTIPNYTEKEDWEDNTYLERDKYIAVRVHSDNMEFVRLNEPYLTVSLYAKRPYRSRKHGSSNKWRAIHQPVTNEHNMVISDQKYSLGYLPCTQQFSTYNLLENNTSIYCSRVDKSPTYILPVTAKNLVQSLFKIKINDGDPTNDMNDERILKVLRFGCGTEKAVEEGITKVYSKIFHSGNRAKPFCTYGSLDETIGVFSIPSLSLILATNLVYCNNREINNTENLIRTDLIQCRLYVTLDQHNDVGYGFRDKLTKSISSL